MSNKFIFQIKLALEIVLIQQYVMEKLSPTTAFTNLIEMMVLLGFVAHWCRMGTGTVWTGTETDQQLQDSLPVTPNKPSIKQYQAVL